MSSQNTIKIVNLAPHLYTAYGPGGRTRVPETQKPYPIEQCIKVGRAGPAGTWQLSAGTAKDYESLAAFWYRRTGTHLRLVEGRRAQAIQAAAHTAYRAWRKAGKPTPGSANWLRGMKTAYVRPPNESHHGWGGAIDIDEDALYTHEYGLGTPGTLGEFWRIAANYGFLPIITEPDPDRDEAWHFDHLGPFLALRDWWKDNSPDERYRAMADKQVALIACCLAGTYIGRNDTEFYIQARLASGGYWIGKVDGVLGQNSKKAIEAALGRKPRTGKPLEIVALLNEANVGVTMQLTA